MKKRALSLLLATSMLVTPAVSFKTYAETVKDYEGHWAEEAITSWIDEARIKGYPDGTFRPDGKITRAEFVTLVNNLFEFTETEDIAFEDVDSEEWYYEEVQKAYKAGFIAGLSETEFAPESNITREQAAIIIARLMELEANAGGAEIFEDHDKISEWAVDFVGAAAESKLVLGYAEDNTFKPQNSITRAEAVVTLDRTIDEENSNETEEPEVPETPENPETPEEPEVPETPEVSETPEETETPDENNLDETKTPEESITEEN